MVEKNGTRFVLCHCQRHGRLIGAPGRYPIELGSYEMSDALFAMAEREGAFAPGGLKLAKDARKASMMALKEEGIEPALRERIVLWNLAAATTTDPDAFAETDFHAYHADIDDFGSN